MCWIENIVGLDRAAAECRVVNYGTATDLEKRFGGLMAIRRVLQKFLG
jgi:hypothetical protein